MVLVFDESGTLVERLLHGPQVDQVLASEDASGDVQWFLGDHLGTIRDVVEYDSGMDSTTVDNRLQYSSFGQITSQASSTCETRPVEKGDRHAECCLRLVMTTAEAASQSPFSTIRYAFTGRKWDADADLYYYRARWYDPTAARFISEDPIGFAAGDVNVFRYLGNTPVANGDPTGLDDPTWIEEYTHYLMNPSDMDTDLEYLSYGAWTVEGTAAGILAIELAAIGAAAIPSTLTIPSITLPAMGAGMVPALVGGGSVGAGTIVVGGGTIATADLLGASAVVVAMTASGPGLSGIDATGKIHEHGNTRLPKPEEFSKFERHELEQLQRDLVKNIAERMRKVFEKGRHKPHGERIGQAQDLLKYLEKYLRETFGH